MSDKIPGSKRPIPLTPPNRPMPPKPPASPNKVSEGANIPTQQMVPPMPSVKPPKKD